MALAGCGGRTVERGFNGAGDGNGGKGNKKWSGGVHAARPTAIRRLVGAPGGELAFRARSTSRTWPPPYRSPVRPGGGVRGLPRARHPGALSSAGFGPPGDVGLGCASGVKKPIGHCRAGEACGHFFPFKEARHRLHVWGGPGVGNLGTKKCRFPTGGDRAKKPGPHLQPGLGPLSTISRPGGVQAGPRMGGRVLAAKRTSETGCARWPKKISLWGRRAPWVVCTGSAARRDHHRPGRPNVGPRARRKRHVRNIRDSAPREKILSCGGVKGPGPFCRRRRTLWQRKRAGRAGRGAQGQERAPFSATRGGGPWATTAARRPTAWKKCRAGKKQLEWLLYWIFGLRGGRSKLGRRSASTNSNLSRQIHLEAQVNEGGGSFGR